MKRFIYLLERWVFEWSPFLVLSIKWS